MKICNIILEVATNDLDSTAPHQRWPQFANQIVRRLALKLYKFRTKFTVKRYSSLAKNLY